MTRKEAINRLLDMGNEIRAYCDNAKHMSEDDRKTMETYDLAIKALEQEPVLDKIRAEIGKSKAKHEMQIAEKNIKAKLLISDIYCDIVNILDKYKAESEETDADN